MTRGRARSVGAVAFLAALGTRLAGVALTTTTSLNPYAQADADRFAASAAETAATLASGHLPVVPTNPNRVVTLWGIVLSPLWLLPGPSRLYGRVFAAVLGAVAVYALVRLAGTLHSRDAGIVAAVPLVCYPSFVLVHSTVLRESFVVAGLVGATYLLVGADAEASVRQRAVRYLAAAGALVLISVVRWENLPLYALTVGAGVLVRYRDAIPRPRLAAAGTVAAGLVGTVLARPLVRDGLDFLVVKRERRSEGRTVYLPEFRPDTLPKAVGFAPIGAIYFLFTPFPWMVETTADAVVFVEALGNLGGAGLAIVGLPVLWRRSKPVAAALAVGFLAGVVLYGLVNANVGTNVRQRQMFLWILFLFAGVAVADRVDANRVRRWVEWWRTE